MKKEYSDFVKDSLKFRPIAYYPIYSDMAGSVLGGVILSQLMYWFRKKSKVFKSEGDLIRELGTTRGQLRTSLTRLKKLPFLHISREGARGVTHYTLNRKVFQEYIINYIKDSPELAERYIEELSQHEDFMVFYAEFFQDMAESNLAMAESSLVMAESNLTMAESDPVMAESSHDSVETSQLSSKNGIKSEDIDKTTMAESNHDSAEDNLAMAGNNRAMAGIDTSLTKTNKTTIERETTVVGTNDTDFASTEQNPSDSSLDSPLGDKPLKSETPTYSPEFEFAWKLYKVDGSIKGNKKKASIAFEKALKLHKDSQLIFDAIDLYKQSTSFELRPAQAASFLNGICNPGHKYYLDYLKGGYEAKLEIVKAKEVVRMKENLSQQEMYRKDLGKQGDLNTQDLMDRTTKINLVLTEQYGVDVGIFRFQDRSNWIKYTGPDYIAIPIKHPMSKTDKIKVLFHIDELRNNLYVHLHGHVWNEKFENQFVNSNEGFSDLPSIEPPKKEDF